MDTKPIELDREAFAAQRVPGGRRLMTAQVWHQGAPLGEELSGHGIYVARKWSFNSVLAGLRHVGRSGLRLRTIHRQLTDPTVGGDRHQRPPPDDRRLTFSPADMTLRCWVDAHTLGTVQGRVSATSAPRRAIPSGATVRVTCNPDASAAPSRRIEAGRDLVSPFREHTQTCLSAHMDGELAYHHHGECLLAVFILLADAEGISLAVSHGYELGVRAFSRRVREPAREITIQL